MENYDHNITLTQPSLKGAKVPNGYVLLNSKYHGNILEKAITECGLRLVYDDTIGLVDCYPSSHCAIVIAQECHLVNTIEMKQKIKKLSKFSHHKVILIEDTETSHQYFQELQKDLLLSDSKINLIPFSTFKDVGLLLKQMNQLETSTNQFTVKNKGQLPYEDAIMSFMLSFPGIGEKKALDLLKNYQSIEDLSKASVEDLSKLVGNSNAVTIKKTLTT